MWRFGSTRINSAAVDESSRSLHSRQVLFRNNREFEAHEGEGQDDQRIGRSNFNFMRFVSFLVKIVLMTHRSISAMRWRKM
jgi:hypothetical protein